MTIRSSLKVLRPLAVGALALALATPAVAMPLDPGTPTQQQVDAAKAATGAAAASVAAIESAYAAANVRLADLDKAAAVAAEAYNSARLALEDATAKAAESERRASGSAAEAATSAKVVRAYAAQMYQSQGGLDSLGAYLEVSGPQQLADRAAALEAIGATRRQDLDRASRTANTAAEDRRAADVARQQREAATAKAGAARVAAEAAATSAQADADRIAGEQQARLSTLATLRQTSVEVEQARQDGLARQAAAEEAARQAAAARAAAEAAAKAAADQAAADAAAKQAAAREAAAREAAAKAAADQAARDAAAAAAAAAAAEAAKKAPAPTSPTAPTTPATPTAPTAPTTPAAPTTPPAPTKPAVSGNKQKVLDYAYAQLGKPYIWGGEGPVGYDCSGLTLMAYKQIGVYMAHGSQWQYNNGTKIPLSQAQPGDLVFFGNSGPTNHHVGIYIGNGQMIHAPNSRTVVKISSIYYSGDLIQTVARY